MCEKAFNGWRHSHTRSRHPLESRPSGFLTVAQTHQRRVHRRVEQIVLPFVGVLVVGVETANLPGQVVAGDAR